LAIVGLAKRRVVAASGVQLDSQTIAELDLASSSSF
jgi:hypothetical protein